jgi:hypothetical protein
MIWYIAKERREEEEREIKRGGKEEAHFSCAGLCASSSLTHLLIPLSSSSPLSFAIR